MLENLRFMGEGKGEVKRQMQGNGERTSAGVVKAVKAKNSFYCRVYAREPRRVPTPSEQNKITSEKDKTISEVISSTSEKNKTTSEVNVARSLGGEVAGHFLTPGCSCSAFRGCAGLSPEGVKSVLK